MTKLLHTYRCGNITVVLINYDFFMIKCVIKTNIMKPYLLSVVKEEQSGISSYSIFRTHFIMLSAVHLQKTHCDKYTHADTDA